MVGQQTHALRPELNPVRIAGTSAAIALHVCVLMLLLTPTQWSPPEAVADDPTDLIAQPIEILQPPPIPIPVVPHPQPPRPAQPSRQDTIQQDSDVISHVPSDIVVNNNDTDMHDETFVVAPPPAAAELTADVAPTPPYPPIALREGTTGLVMLRIGVDASGHPFEGRIEKTSGSRLLDQAALKFVLAHWHFNPAMRGGAAVAAVALVPIEFSLNQ